MEVSEKNSEKHLSSTIRLLGQLLGQTIVQQAGRELFDLEETIRQLAKQWRAGDPQAMERLKQLMPDLADDLPKAIDIVKAFSTYFQLVNLAEEHERARILRERAAAANEAGQPMDESIAAAIGQLSNEGFSGDDIQQMLGDMLIMPVFTAHPTESRRRTIRQILERTSRALYQLQSPATLSHEKPALFDEIRRYIVLLWQSDEARDRRPTVLDEVRNTGLYFFEQTLFDIVPRIYEHLEEALEQIYPDHRFDIPAILTFGSWIGGDRDGNPLVTNEVTKETLRSHKEVALQRYSEDVHALYRLLSPSRDRVSFSEEFFRALQNDLELLPPEEREHLDRFHQEPYRQKLILMYRRLQTTLQETREWKHQMPWGPIPQSERSYSEVGEFQNDLALIEKSLRENRGAELVRGELARLIRRVDVFGFHLASLDIRQHSERHGQALAEITETYGLAEDYHELAEDDKVELLTREIQHRRPLTAALHFSNETNETVALMRLIKQAQQQSGQASIQTYIVSMTHSVSHILEVLALMRDADLFGQLDLVPLFETIDDLQRAPKMIASLFENPAYREHLQQRRNRQQIMIGYSDSNKDGGYLRANWKLFTAQRELAETCRAYQVGLTLFHGRGGSLGRGGGPANRAILAQPPESVNGRIRLTEQGEVVSSRYTHNAIAERHLQQLLHAVICSSGERPEFKQLAEWSEVMEDVSQRAYRHYRTLVEDTHFVDYFHDATPIDQMGRLNLGSRPASRSASESLEDLRAIPWVFAWTQSRTNVPSWYGIGSAIKEWTSEESNRLEQLQTMYQQWPFFRTSFNNVHLGLGRADMEIAGLYAELADPDGHPLFNQIRQEFELTRQFVLQVTQMEELLDTEPWLQHSIRMRNPYVDPLNCIQVALLQRIRRTQEMSDRDRALLQTAFSNSVSGIAAGLQNVG